MSGINDIEIQDEDFQDIQRINWDGPVQIYDSSRNILDVGAYCPRFNPCPVCYKCTNKASHLFSKCRDCTIPMCIHSDKQKNMVIRRANFHVPVSEDMINALDEQAEKLALI